MTEVKSGAVNEEKLVNNEFIIKPLSEELLEKAIVLASENFPYKEEYTPPEQYLRMSLSPEQFANLYEKEGIKDNKYYVATEQSSGKLIGIIGYYRLKQEDPSTFWVDWFCVDKKYRNKGLGKQLLNFNEEKVKEKGGKVLKVWTSDWGEESLSQPVYESAGYKFERMVPDNKHQFNNIYRKKELGNYK